VFALVFTCVVTPFNHLKSEFILPNVQINFQFLTRRKGHRSGGPSSVS